MIKAAFFDIDGTLLSFKTHRIPASAQQVLDCFHEQGIACVIATGRPDLPDAGLAVRPGLGCVHYAFGASTALMPRGFTAAARSIRTTSR